MPKRANKADLYNRKIEVLVALIKQPNLTSGQLRNQVLDYDQVSPTAINMDLQALSDEGLVQRSRGKPYRWKTTNAVQ